MEPSRREFERVVKQARGNKEFELSSGKQW